MNKWIERQNNYIIILLASLFFFVVTSLVIFITYGFILHTMFLFLLAVIVATLQILFIEKINSMSFFNKSK
jgi:hypothetical protein